MSFRVFGMWLHLLAVVIWVGGAFFWVIVLLTRRRSRKHEDILWIETLGRRFYVISWEALGLLVLTGLFNLIPRIQTGMFFQSAYFTPLLIKLGLVAGMVGIQLWQHFGLLPRRAAEGTRWRRLMLVASGVFLALAAGALWVGVWLHRG